MLFIFIKVLRGQFVPCFTCTFIFIIYVISLLRGSVETFPWKDFFPVFYHNFSRGRKKRGEKNVSKVVYSFHSFTEDFRPYFFSASSCLLYLSSSLSYFLGNLAVLKTFQSSLFRLVSKDEKLLLKNETLDSVKKWH